MVGDREAQEQAVGRGTRLERVAVCNGFVPCGVSTLKRRSRALQLCADCRELCSGLFPRRCGLQEQTLHRKEETRLWVLSFKLFL